MADFHPWESAIVTLELNCVCVKVFSQTRTVQI